MTYTAWNRDSSGFWSALTFDTVCRWFGHKPLPDNSLKCARCGAIRFKRY